MYTVTNGHTVWNEYTNKEDAEYMANYLNDKYHNGYYVEDIMEKNTATVELTKEDMERARIALSVYIGKAKTEYHLDDTDECVIQAREVWRKLEEALEQMKGE